MNPTSAEPTRVAAVVYNPIKVDIKALRTSVAAAEREAGWKASLWFEFVAAFLRPTRAI